jgi:D-threo-aldose 1-dehydrogenase
MNIARRRIGTTDLWVSELGFGSATLGNLYSPVTDYDARAAIDTSLAAGVTYIDTAPHYGRGLSERRVGDAVRLASNIVVSTKVGRLMEPDNTIRDDREREGFRSPLPFRSVYDYSYDGILRSHEHSLHRLGLAKIDLLLVHDIGRLTHGERADHYWDQLTKGAGLKALNRLRDEDVIGGFGIGVNEVEVCIATLRETRLDAILLAGRYSLLEQDALGTLFPICAPHGTSLIIGGPYNSGILATGTRGTGPFRYNYGDAPAAIVAKVRRIEDIAARHNVPLAAAALQFVLAHPQVASVIPGIDSAARVEATIDLYQTLIPPDFWSELRHDGLLQRECPTP